MSCKFALCFVSVVFDGLCSQIACLQWFLLSSLVELWVSGVIHMRFTSLVFDLAKSLPHYKQSVKQYRNFLPLGKTCLCPYAASFSAFLVSGRVVRNKQPHFLMPPTGYEA